MAVLLAGGTCTGCALDQPPEEQLVAQVWKRGEPPRELRSGDSVATGDELYMTLVVLSHRPLHVYVLSEDARRAREILYPCRDWAPSPPFAQRSLRLPPTLLGRETFWPVRTATPQERLLVLFSTRSLPALEASVLAASDAPPCAAPLSGDAGRWLDDLRIADLVPRKSPPGAYHGSWKARETGQEGGILKFDFAGVPDRG